MNKVNANGFIDWEELMVASERNSKSAAKLTERIVAGVVEVLEIQRRHSHQLTKMETALEELRARAPVQSKPQAPSQNALQFKRVRILPYVSAFAAGAAFVAYFVSW